MLQGSVFFQAGSVVTLRDPVFRFLEGGAAIFFTISTRTCSKCVRAFRLPWLFFITQGQ
jgi:hypothetical protein